MTDNPSLEAHPNVEDWIVVRADGGVEVRTGKVEIGQGIDTAVALIVADELGVPFDRVAMMPVSTELSPDEGYTAGSSSLEHSGQALRLAAATLRRELLRRASQRLGVDAADGMARSRGHLGAWPRNVLRVIYKCYVRRGGWKEAHWGFHIALTAGLGSLISYLRQDLNSAVDGVARINSVTGNRHRLRQLDLVRAQGFHSGIESSCLPTRPPW
ncbi:MAG: molybdopterin-dependent oxidoreductase [bacterium]|nr:molybdopterin-dependent oxidoreductase [bacterium]